MSDDFLPENRGIQFAYLPEFDGSSLKIQRFEHRGNFLASGNASREIMLAHEVETAFAYFQSPEFLETSGVLSVSGTNSIILPLPFVGESASASFTDEGGGSPNCNFPGGSPNCNFPTCNPSPGDTVNFALVNGGSSLLLTWSVYGIRTIRYSVTRTPSDTVSFTIQPLSPKKTKLTINYNVVAPRLVYWKTTEITI